MNITKGKSRFLLVMLFASAFVGASAFAAVDQAAVDKCKSCHEETVTNFMKGAHHGKAFAKGDMKYSCESCHGAGDKHIAAGGGKDSIVSFGKKSEQSAAEQSKQCLSCHEKNESVAMWDAGNHKKNGVSCASCHDIHKPGLKAKAANNTCFECHKDIKAQVNKMSHHPIIEGKVSCSDCHNPHGALGHGMIKADNNNQLCYKCHADKRGPFMWEHPPVEENCNTCHTPHGSQHRSLLNQKGPNLCQDCHTAGRHPSAQYNASQTMEVASPAAQFITRNCLNCHSRIHGSNAPHNPEASAGYNSGKFFLK